MKMNFLKDEDKHLEVEMDGELHAFPNALREILSDDKDVEYVAYKLEHPQVGKPVLVILTKKGKARDKLEAALKTLAKMTSEFQGYFKKEKKSSK